MVVERLSSADVIYAEGGNVYHLANSIIANGLAAQMTMLLESKVYVGVSAGSMIFSRNMSNRTGEIFDHEKLRILGDTPARSPFGLYDWYVKPHLNSLHYPGRTPAWYKKAAAQVDFPVYALDDDSAVRIRGDKVDVVSAGEWRLLNAREALAADWTSPKHRRAPSPAGGIGHQVHSWRNKLVRIVAAGAARGRRAYGTAFRRGW